MKVLVVGPDRNDPGGVANYYNAVFPRLSGKVWRLTTWKLAAPMGVSRGCISLATSSGSGKLWQTEAGYRASEPVT